jgi:hypothetical protein
MIPRWYILLSLLLGLNPSILSQTINRYALVIDELLPDPLPSAGLPSFEFIELKNTSNSPIQLRGCKISDGSSTAIINSSFVLQPDSFIIICSNSAITSFNQFGSVIGVSSFPSLNNDADIISLYASNGNILHSVAYDISWYNNSVKQEGGWTLEMIDTGNPCSGVSNWKASMDARGGTPGTINSVNDINKDDQPPALLRTYTIDSLTLVAVFDESLDSNAAADANHYQLNNAIKVIFAIPEQPLFREVRLGLNSPLAKEIIYELSVKSLNDCAGNEIGTVNKTKAALPITADTMNIVINEILFNPASDGFDYVEIYNRSKSSFDCRQLYIANRNSLGTISNIKQVCTSSLLLFPGDFLVLTESRRWLQQNYVVKNPSQVLELSELPSLPDDKGVIILLNHEGKIVDELQYNRQWHFPLLNNDDGVSLERIDYNQPTQLSSNWTSAASTLGFGTPSYQNSQYRADLQIKGDISTQPKVFSPDNDGFDDFVTIGYRLEEPGYVANISIYDIAGRTVRSLVRNATLSNTGSFRWDGLSDTQQKLPVGHYIIVTELFNLRGRVRRFKNVVVVARKL